MKYERLTNRGEPFYGFEKCKTCEYGKDGCDNWCDQITACFCRLQELEDKIESGKLCDRDEVRKETAREIAEMLKAAKGVIKVHFEAYNELIENIVKKYGVKLEDEE